MKLSISVALLVVVVLATATEAGWVRNTLRRVGQATRGAIEEETVKGIRGIVQGVGSKVGRKIIGKRSVDWRGMMGKAGEFVAQTAIGQLEQACLRFNDLKNKNGLTADDLKVAFSQTDDNKDGRLNNVELDLFENVVDAVQHCLELLKKSRTGQGM